LRILAGQKILSTALITLEKKGSILLSGKMLTVSTIVENWRLAQDLGHLDCGKAEEKENSGTVERMARSSRALFSTDDQSAAGARKTTRAVV